jgi:hypothetical protein|nr:MAG TPA: Endonuclease [Caudoviricetes sp.]
MRVNRPKYGNSKVSFNGHTFDSKREKDRYIVLKEAQEKGIISDLELQPKWELIPKITETYVKHLKTKDKICERTAQLPITYTADFAYTKDGERIIEDVKISPKMLPKEFVLKVKMMRAIYGIKVRCVYKASEAI